MRDKKSNERIVYIDVLRIVAILGVILIHSCTYYDQAWILTTNDWLVYVFYHSIARFCVPLFVMITGTLLLNRNEKWSYFIRHYWIRLVAICFFWQMFYFCLNHNLPNLTTASGWYELLFFADGAIHLWYLRMIILVYLLILPLRLVVRKITHAQLTALCAVWTLIVIGSHLLEIIFHKPPINSNWIFDYGLYLILGYYLHHYRLEFSRFFYYLLIGLYITATAINIYAIWWLWTSHQLIDTNFSNYLSPTVFLSSIAIFLLVQNSKLLEKISKNVVISKILFLVSKMTFGIYLVHMIFINILQQNSYTDGSFPRSYIGIPLMAFFAFILSWLLVTIIYKIPFCKKLIS